MVRIGIVIFVVLLFASVFYSLQNQTPHPEPEVFARVQELRGSALNVSGRIPLIVGDELFAPLEIQTDSKSHISLTLVQDDVRIEVGPETQVQFNSTAEGPSIQVKGNEFFVSYHSRNKLRSLKLKIDSLDLSTEAADLFFLRRPNRGLEISVPFGSVNVRNEQNRYDVQNGNVIYFDHNTVTVAPTEIRVNTPLPLDRFSSLEPEMRIRFSAAELKKEMRLWLGERPDNLKPVGVADKEVVRQLSPGTYYSQFSLNATRSPIVKFFVDQLYPIDPEVPANGATVGKKSAHRIRLAWKNPSRLEKAFVEVSRHPHFKDLVYHEVVPRGDFLYVQIESSGEYFWRVNGFPFRSSKLILGNVHRLLVE